MAEQLIRKKLPGARLKLYESDQLAFRGLRQGECDFVLSDVTTWNRIQQRDAEINGDCQLTWVGRVFRFMNGGFAVQVDSGTLCTWLIRDVLHLHLLEMMEEGDLQTLWKQELERSATVQCDAVVGSSVSSDDGDSSQLGIQDTGGIFIVHYGLIFVSILMALASKRKNPLCVAPSFSSSAKQKTNKQCGC